MSEADPTPAAEAASDARQRERYGLLLLSIVASVAVEGIASGGDAEEAAVTVLLGATLLLAFWAADMPARRLRRAAILVAALVAAVIVGVVLGHGSTVAGVTRLANALLVALAPPAVVVGVVRSLQRHQAVTLQAVFGALCLYLLVGMLFTFVYGAMNEFGTASFFAYGAEVTSARLTYYSFTTLTTVGYGDFTARTNLGHTLSVMEALIGQIYLVTVVAVIVSNLAPRRPRST